MKLWEILLEFRDYVDINQYGSWIDTDNQRVYSIRDAYGHSSFVQQNIQMFDNDDLDIDWFAGNPYLLAYYNGFVRMAHDKGGQSLDIEGRGEDIKKISTLILEIMKDGDFSELNIDVISNLKPDKNADPLPIKQQDYYFSFPTEIRKFNQFIRSI